MGVGVVQLSADGVSHFLTIILPPVSVARQMARTEAYWKDDWVCYDLESACRIHSDPTPSAGRTPETDPDS
jgi:hypothetical protein